MRGLERPTEDTIENSGAREDLVSETFRIQSAWALSLDLAEKVERVKGALTPNALRGAR